MPARTKPRKSSEYIMLRMVLQGFLGALLVAAALGAAATTLAAADAPLGPGMETTDQTCTACGAKLVKKSATGVLHCTRPDCHSTFFIDKQTGKLHALVSVASEGHAQQMLNPELQARVQKELEAKRNTPDVGKVGDQFFGKKNALRVAGAGDEWHEKNFDPNGSSVPKITLTEVDCPVCGVHLKEPVEGNRNYKAGVDRDFMRHSLGTFAVASIVWLCPDCGYAALPEDFTKPVAAPFKALMLHDVKPAMQTTMIDLIRNNSGDPNKELPASELAFHEYVDINDIPDYLKYERACAVQADQKKLDTKFPEWDCAVKARVYTEAAYACREYLSGTIENGALVRVPLLQRSVQFVRGLIVQQPDQIDNVEAQYENLRIMLDDFLNGDPTKPGRPRYEEYAFLKYYLMLNKAGLEDRLGRPQEAYRSLRDALEAVPSPALFVSATEKMLLVPVLKQFQKEAELRISLLKLEQEYLRRAALNSVVALHLGRYPRKDLTPQIYLVAEQMRRVGAYRRSLAWFELSEKLNGEAGPLTLWTRDQAALVRNRKVAADTQDQKLFEHLLAAWANKDQQAIPAFPNPPEEFSLIPDQVATPDPTTAAAAGGTPGAAEGAHTVAEALARFYAALDAHRKLTGNLPGLPEEMVQKGTWKGTECRELQFKDKKVLYGERRLAFVYDAGGTTGWGSKSHFLLMPAAENDKAMFVLCGNGEVIDLNAPAPK